MAATVKYQGAFALGVGNTRFATPESGGFTLGDRNLFVDVWAGTYADCVSGALLRGTYGSGARAGFVVSESVVEKMKGAWGKLTIRWEPGGASADANLLPNDEFDVSIIELYPKIERNAYFDGITRDTMALAYGAVFGATKEKRDAEWDELEALVDATQKALGEALVEKWQRGEETFYQAGVQYVWIWHSFTVPSLSAGGFIEAPDGPMAGEFTGLDFLRKADIIKPKGVNGSCYEIQSCWVGGPSGYWDADLYPTPA